MSNRQERIARKQRQREGTEVFVHLKPTRRELGPIRVAPAIAGMLSYGANERKRRFRRYEAKTIEERRRGPAKEKSE